MQASQNSNPADLSDHVRLLGQFKAFLKTAFDLTRPMPYQGQRFFSADAMAQLTILHQMLDRLHSQITYSSVANIQAALGPANLMMVNSQLYAQLGDFDQNTYSLGFGHSAGGGVPAVACLNVSAEPRTDQTGKSYPKLYVLEVDSEETLTLRMMQSAYEEDASRCTYALRVSYRRVLDTQTNQLKLYSGWVQCDSTIAGQQPVTYLYAGTMLGDGGHSGEGAPT